MKSPRFTLFMLVFLGGFLLLGIYAGVRLAAGANIAQGLAQGNLQVTQAQSVVATCDKAAASWAWLDDPLVAATEILPVVGGDISAARELVGGVARICTPAKVLMSGFDDKNPLNSLRRIGPARFRYAGLDLIQKVKELSVDLTEIDARFLHFGLANQISKIKSRLTNFSLYEPELKSMVSVGSAILASKTGSTWLIATQNLAEARGTGGILGSYAVIKVGTDRVVLVEAGSDQTLAGYGPVVSSSLPIDTGLIWGVEPRLWQDLNPSAHAPYTSQQVFDSWQKYKHEKLSGVIFIGQGWAQNLVALVGPLTYEGLTIDASNTADFLAKGIYQRYREVGKKNAVVSGIMQQLAAKLAVGNFELSGFVEALRRNPTGDKLFAWSPNALVERRLVADQAAGFVDSKPGNRVWLTVNNGGGNKLDAYVHLKAKYSVAIRNQKRSPSSQSTLDVSILNDSPRTGLPPYVNGRLDLPAGTKYQPGSNVDLVSVYLPVGAELTGFFVDGEPFSVHDAIDRGHEVLGFRLELRPHESKIISLSWNLSGTQATEDFPALETNSLFNKPKMTGVLTRH